jgi:predicted phage terminase large subunit-like protein
MDWIAYKIKAAEELQRRKDEEDKLAMEQSLHKYIPRAWEIIEPGITYIDNWHIEAICEYLEAVSLGQINRLLINMPPRYMKSISVTVGWPTWVWTKDPYKRFISLSYSATLSKKHNINRRDIIQSPWYQKKWRDKFVLRDDKNTQMLFENDKMGFMFATSIGGTLTGEGGDYIVVDDPHNPQQAQSDAERESALEFFKTTLPTRLNDKKKGAIIVVMQRLHEADISGHCLKEGGYTHLCLPGIAERKQIITFPITLKEIVREEGDILWPEREDKKELDAMKKALGTYGFSGQYQQDPSPAGGGMIKRCWWRYWKPKGVKLPTITEKLEDGTYQYIEAVDLPDYWDEQIQSWDCTFKKEEDNDYVCGGVIARRLANYYFMDLINDKMGIVDTMKNINEMTKRWPEATLKLVEDKANGSAVIEMLQDKIPGIVPVNPKGDKISRANAVAPVIQSGNVYLPHPLIHAWVNDFIEQCSKFPKGVNDDMVDMMSQGLTRLISRTFDTQPPEQDPDNPSYEDKYQKMVSDIMGGDVRINM